mgnify:CR=1 FL=1
MSELSFQESPLVLTRPSESKGKALGIEEKPFLGFLNLRGRPDNKNFLGAASKTLGCDLPLEANTMVEAGDNRIYWLGPDEWLIVTQQGDQSRIQADLITALGGEFAAVVDNSSGLTLVEITGDNAAALLATDCPLDLHTREFTAGQCAQTRLAKAGMTIAPMRDSGGFEVIIRRSFADYLMLWLLDASIAFD